MTGAVIISKPDQWTGFYMIPAPVMKELNEYQSELKVEGESIADPLDSMEGWKGEEHIKTRPKCI